MLSEYEQLMSISPRAVLGSDVGRINGYVVWQFLPNGELLIDTNALCAAFATLTTDQLRGAIPRGAD